MNNIKELEDLKEYIGFIRQEGFYEQAHICIAMLEDKIKALQGNLAYEQEMIVEWQKEWANASSKADIFKKAIEKILEYIKYEIDTIEVVDKIEHILMEVNYYEQH